MIFTGTCPVCGATYTPLDAEVSHSGRFVVTADDDDLAADKGEEVEQVCETCHSQGRVARDDTRDP